MLTRVLRRLFGRDKSVPHEIGPEELKFLSAVEQAPYHPFAEAPPASSPKPAPPPSSAPPSDGAPPADGPPETPASPAGAPTTQPGEEPAPALPACQPFRDSFRDSGEEGPAMVWLAGGRFRMGEDQHASLDEKPIHPVTLDAFAVGQYPVTFAEFDRFCEATGREKPEDRGWGREARPVINVSWREAMLYCEWLSDRTGQPYRLCTEAEWEYACRAGADTRYCFGDDPAGLGEYAWFRDNAGGTTQPVGLKQPNAWQLYDMHGNAFEWVVDWLGPYDPEPRHNPTGPEWGAARVIRGGAWDTGPDACRASFRDSSHPALHVRGLGFRLARGGPAPGEAPPPAKPRFDDFQVFRDHPQAPELVYLPGDNFFMGSDRDSGVARERPLHLVSLDGFAMGRYPVTVEEYLRFVAQTGQHAPDWMDEDSSFHLENGSDAHYQRVAVDPEAGRHPVVGVSHEDAWAYCHWLSALTGERYELPTEAEWEYACRAGSDTAYCFGDEVAELAEYAWYDDNADLTLQDVGQKQPNAWGLYDMHGLVWEWVADWYGEYPVEPVENPRGALVGSHRVLRGGSWNDSAALCRAAFRARQVPGYRVSHLGFRVVRRG